MYVTCQWISTLCLQPWVMCPRLLIAAWRCPIDMRSAAAANTQWKPPEWLLPLETSSSKPLRTRLFSYFPCGSVQ